MIYKTHSFEREREFCAYLQKANCNRLKYSGSWRCRLEIVRASIRAWTRLPLSMPFKVWPPLGLKSQLNGCDKWNSNCFIFYLPALRELLAVSHIVCGIFVFLSICQHLIFAKTKLPERGRGSVPLLPIKINMIFSDSFFQDHCWRTAGRYIENTGGRSERRSRLSLWYCRR